LFPFVECLENDEHGAVVRAVGVQDERLPWNRHGVGRAGCLQSDFCDGVADLDRALQRGRIRQLNVGEEVALVLDRDEAARNAAEAQTRQTEQTNIAQEHDRAQADAPAHSLAVELRGLIEETVESTEEL